MARGTKRGPSPSATAREQSGSADRARTPAAKGTRSKRTATAEPKSTKPGAAAKKTSAKSAASQPLTKTSKAASPRSKSVKPRQAKPAAAKPTSQRTEADTSGTEPASAGAQTEKDSIIADLTRELEAARARIADLERRQDVVANRIDWILDTLRTATEPVKQRKPRISRKAR